jgi:hypothetical protein
MHPIEQSAFSAIHSLRLLVSPLMIVPAEMKNAVNQKNRELLIR